VLSKLDCQLVCDASSLFIDHLICFRATFYNGLELV
jgi:hypothetical protein